MIQSKRHIAIQSSLEEVRQRLLSMLKQNFTSDCTYSPTDDTYGEVLQNIGVCIERFLELHLSLDDRWSQWMRVAGRWVDGCIIMRSESSKGTISIFGVAVWGAGGEDQDWLVGPFEVEFRMHEKHVASFPYTLRYGDLAAPEMTYEEFNTKRHHWNNAHNNWAFTVKETIEAPAP